MYKRQVLNSGKSAETRQKQGVKSYKMLDLAKRNKYEYFRLLNIYNLGERACIFRKTML